jgi:hypothetical protein
MRREAVSAITTKELFGVVVFGWYKGMHVADHTAHANCKLITDIKSRQSERQPW